MEQHTLVAFYGKKTEAFSFMIQSVWREIQKSSLKEFFIPYEMDQVHATICGMEQIPGFSLPFNLNIWEKTGSKKEMDFSGLPSTLESFLPLTIQFGGFPETFSTVKSFGQSLYQRSFRIDRVSGRVILIGWPVNSRGEPTETLLRLREQLHHRHQMLHKYQDDNDCYMVLGILKGLDQATPEEIQYARSAQQDLEIKIRHHLSVHPQQPGLDWDDLSVVQYTDHTLPLSNSRPRPLDSMDEWLN